MRCAICHKPVILTPSAQERARRFGGTAADYARLFQTHAVCQLAQRDRELTRLIRHLERTRRHA